MSEVNETPDTIRIAELEAENEELRRVIANRAIEAGGIVFVDKPRYEAILAVVDEVRRHIVASGSGHVDCGDEECALCKLRRMIVAIET